MGLELIFHFLFPGHERFYNPDLLMPSFLMSSYAQAAAAYANSSLVRGTTYYSIVSF